MKIKHLMMTAAFCLCSISAMATVPTPAYEPQVATAALPNTHTAEHAQKPNKPDANPEHRSAKQMKRDGSEAKPPKQADDHRHQNQQAQKHGKRGQHKHDKDSQRAAPRGNLHEHEQARFAPRSNYKDSSHFVWVED